MGTLTVIFGKLKGLLGLGSSGAVTGSGEPGTRVCAYGHAVFSGNNLCNYGHHAA